MSCCHHHGGSEIDHYDVIGEIRPTSVEELKRIVAECSEMGEDLVIYSQGCTCGTGEHFTAATIVEVGQTENGTKYAKLACGSYLDLSLDNQWFLLDSSPDVELEQVYV